MLMCPPNTDQTEQAEHSLLARVPAEPVQDGEQPEPVMAGGLEQRGGAQGETGLPAGTTGGAL